MDIHTSSPTFNVDCILLKLLFYSLEFLVSELQAAETIRHKELHPEEKTGGDESQKEQRIKDYRQEEYHDNGISHEDRRKAEMQAEWILLLHALDMDTSSQFADVLSEVSLI